MPPGAMCVGEGRCRFTVWAPVHDRVLLRLHGKEIRTLPLQPLESGYHTLEVEGAGVGTRYTYVLNGVDEFPDPASRYQPEGVHGPSEVCTEDYPWTDEDWSSSQLSDYVIYELHAGTFTDEGTFDAAAKRLSDLKALGITAIELMPVAQFPGARNWGYDGTYSYAVQNSYGGPEGLKGFVDACHRHGMAAVLDVVYNHFGPEGNYAGEFGPYFTDRYHTPWGRAMNFDGPYSDEVRRFFIGNALQWFREYHFDALRLDALHAILDTSAYPFLSQLVDETRAESARQGRPLYLIGESDLNDPRLIKSREYGGMGLDAQWNDDYHHALHTLLTGEVRGYYSDFGCIQHLGQALRGGYVYNGQYSTYRKRSHGAPAEGLSPDHFVVFAQNHDQVGNRLLGDRLSVLVSDDALRLAAACVILGPSIPLLFMGEEYGEAAPFPYFVSHSDDNLIEAVRRGRREEFAVFQWKGEVPDPQDERTFLTAKLDWATRKSERGAKMLDYYAALIFLRRALPVLRHGDTQVEGPDGTGSTLLLRRAHEGSEVVLALNLAETDHSISTRLSPGTWSRRLDSADERWGGQGSAMPERVNSSGTTTLHFRPLSAILLNKD
ncbi:MAG: malto-oligosyltrehalose trehalohydrolase [Dehalococcoidia bacterium]|nr:malto-oligosyltrehalose trehalohydrolase [Dehalococcoidia bacterium]